MPDASSPKKRAKRGKSDKLPNFGTIDYLRQIFESDEEVSKPKDEKHMSFNSVNSSDFSAETMKD
jgi:hypothetical protein